LVSSRIDFVKVMVLPWLLSVSLALKVIGPVVATV
jgi:hypothetical protein